MKINSTAKDEVPLSPTEAQRRNDLELSKVMSDFEEAKAKGQRSINITLLQGYNQVARDLLNPDP